MKERPIIFNTKMVRAILDGRKTQTRRVIKPQPISPTDLDAVKGGYAFVDAGIFDKDPMVKCPYGEPGDRLWVRETHAIVPATAYRMSQEEDGRMIPHAVSPDGHEWAVYRQGWERSAPSWKPSIHMPRWASRIQLEITDVRVERVQDISENDARAEGVIPCEFQVNTICSDLSYRYGFIKLWDSINAPRGYGWNANPWVWVVEFKIADKQDGQ